MVIKHLTIEETAKELEVCERTVWNYIKLGYLQKSRQKIAGRSITVVTTDSLFKFILIPMYLYIDRQKDKYVKLRWMEAVYGVCDLIWLKEMDPSLIELWTYEKTALICNVSVRTVKRWVANGKIPVSCRCGKYNIVYLNNFDVLDYVFHGRITGVDSNRDHYDIIHETVMQICTPFFHRYEVLENHLKQINR